MGAEHKLLTQVASLGSRSLRSDLILLRGRTEPCLALLCHLVSPDPCPTGIYGELPAERRSSSSDFQPPGKAAPLMPGRAPSPARFFSHKTKERFQNPVALLQLFLFLSDSQDRCPATAPGSPAVACPRREKCPRRGWSQLVWELPARAGGSPGALGAVPGLPSRSKLPQGG